MIKCDFCNKDQSEVKQMIAGPNGIAICDECVMLCLDVLLKKSDNIPIINVDEDTLNKIRFNKYGLEE